MLTFIEANGVSPLFHGKENKKSVKSIIRYIVYTMKAANNVKLICILIVNHVIKQRIVQTNYNLKSN